MSGSSSSCHEMTNITTPHAASPGAESGSTARTNAPKRVQPSTRAASSSSGGSEAKYGTRIRTAYGIRKPTSATTTPVRVFRRPYVRNIT